MSPALRRDLAGLGVLLAFAAAGLSSGDAASLWFLVALGIVTLWVVIEDALTFLIADGAVIGLALIALITRFMRAQDLGVPLTESLMLIGLDLALSGGLLWLVREYWYRRHGFDGLGFGDVKLAAAGGLLLGTSGFAAALLVASIGGVGFALGFARRNKAERRIAFGCFLAPAFMLVYGAEAVPGLAALIGGRP